MKCRGILISTSKRQQLRFAVQVSQKRKARRRARPAGILELAGILDRVLWGIRAAQAVRRLSFRLARDPLIIEVGAD